jgi:uncharacterized protein YqhQ
LPRGRFSAMLWDVGAEHLRAMLATADGRGGLPRLGGMARPDGVVIVSERFWAFAGTDGELREGPMPAVAGRFTRVPLLRGLVRLFASLSPLFRGRGVARGRERWVLGLAVVAPFALIAVPERLGTIVGVTLSLGLLGWLLRGRTLYLHGAEHRAIAAAEEDRLAATWEGSARPSRFSVRCGTNFAVLVFPVAFVAERLWPFAAAAYTPLLLSVLSLALTMELWRAVQLSPSAGRLFLLPGLALQRLTTREPTLDETRVALTAVASVLRRELASG